MTISPDDIENRFELPAHWSTSARDLFGEVLSQRPDLAGPELGSLEQAAELTTMADALEAVARAANYTALGSTGQTIVHPAIPEARQARATVATILNRLTPPSVGARTNSQRGSEAAKARWAR